MNFGSTLFLRAIIYLIGLAVLGVCFISIMVTLNTMLMGDPRTPMFLPVVILFNATAIPFFYALYNGLLLLRYIDKNTAFSERSTKAIRNIKYAAFTISVLYAAGMPLSIYVADKGDAPGVVLIGLVFIFATLIVGVFAAVLERLLQNALDIKSENDLTV